MDWDDFRFVQAVAQTGSVRGAGERLGVHGSTVTRHLDQLEQDLGVKLFARTPRGMQITTSGAEVMAALDRVAAELDAVEKNLRSRVPAATGPVALAVPASLAQALVVPQLDVLYTQHPDLDLLLVSRPGLEALEDGDADLALCLTEDPPEHLVGRPLGHTMASAYASVGYSCAEDSGRWIGPRDPGSTSAQIRARWFPDLTRSLFVEDPLLRASALEAGLGVGLLPCHLGDGRGGLIRMAMEPVVQSQVWLFTREDARGNARIQAVSAFLQGLFAAERQRLEGL